MSLLNKLQTQGSNLSDLDGATLSIPNFATSRLHREYSINGNPNITGKPQPSLLDLDGETPPRYLDNPPQ